VTDEDLKRLKATPMLNTEIHQTDFELLEALIARLEAAEDCIDDHRGDCLADIGKACSCGYAEKLTKWRKVCGRADLTGEAGK
jgi:hypothetical protein